jgi:hypothetical protein
MLMSKKYVEKVKEELIIEDKIEDNIEIEYEDKNVQCSKKYP